VLVEAGRNESWETNDLVAEGHYLVVNLADEPLSFEQRDARRWEHVVMAPGSLWINPDGRPFSHRIAQPCHYGGHYATRRRSLARVRGGLGGLRRRRLLDHVEAHLGEDLALSRLSEVAGLSPFHLSREFKRATGETLHRFVMGRRLERARDALRSGATPIAQIALDLGFADQSHLTRLFRLRFGTTPAAFARAHRPGFVLVSSPRQERSKTARSFKKRGGATL
jgi:AraC-like DNA-binding protein